MNIKSKTALSLLFFISIVKLGYSITFSENSKKYNPESQSSFSKKVISSFFIKSNLSKNCFNDTIKPVQIGTIVLSDEFKPLLFIDKNIGVKIFKYTAPFDGNILLNGFVSAGTNGKMLYSRLIKNGTIINQKSCGSGAPLFNGIFNYQTTINKGDKLSIEIIVLETNWQLHCCPDLYNCTYIVTKN